MMFKKLWKFLCMPVTLPVPGFVAGWFRPRPVDWQHVHPQPVVFPPDFCGSEDDWAQRQVEQDCAAQHQAAQDAAWQHQLAQSAVLAHTMEAHGMAMHDLGSVHQAGNAMMQAAHDAALHDAAFHDLGMHSGGMGMGGLP